MVTVVRVLSSFEYIYSDFSVVIFVPDRIVDINFSMLLPRVTADNAVCIKSNTRYQEAYSLCLLTRCSLLKVSMLPPAERREHPRLSASALVVQREFALARSHV